MGSTRIGAITSKARSEMVRSALPRGAIIECAEGRRITDVLRELSRKAVAAAVVDDAALEDPQAAELEMLDWSALPQKHPVRIVFAASPARRAKDPAIKSLSEAAGIEVVRTAHGSFPEGEIARALARAAGSARGDGEAAGMPAHASREGPRRGNIEGTGSIEREPDWSAIMPARTEPVPAKPRRCRTVAAASLFGHPGATTLSMSLAFWLARAKRKKVVCALSDKALFNLLKAGFKTEPGEEGFRYKDVAFCSFDEAERLAADAAWAVYDCGRLFTTRADTPASTAHRRFYTSDMKLMCLQGQPWDAPELKEALAGLSPSEVASWTWCARGASSDLVAMARGYLGDVGADGGAWFKVPENPDFFARASRDGFDEINYEGLLGGKTRRAKEGDSL